jgi:hypothetical protein
MQNTAISLHISTKSRFWLLVDTLFLVAEIKAQFNNKKKAKMLILCPPKINAKIYTAFFKNHAMKIHKWRGSIT